MSAPQLLLLDTTVILHLIRGNETAKRMDAGLNLRARPDKPLISAVTIGEARAFGRYRGWGEPKMDRLESQLRELVVIDINNASILNRYAEIHSYSVKSGIACSDNDVWIAACASATGAILVTNDKDFDAWDPKFLTRMYFPS